MKALSILAMGKGTSFQELVMFLITLPEVFLAPENKSSHGDGLWSWCRQ